MELSETSQKAFEIVKECSKPYKDVTLKNSLGYIHLDIEECCNRLNLLYNANIKIDDVLDTRKSVSDFLSHWDKDFKEKEGKFEKYDVIRNRIIDILNFIIIVAVFPYLISCGSKYTLLNNENLTDLGTYLFQAINYLDFISNFISFDVIGIMLGRIIPDLSDTNWYQVFLGILLYALCFILSWGSLGEEGNFRSSFQPIATSIFLIVITSKGFFTTSEICRKWFILIPSTYILLELLGIYIVKYTVRLFKPQKRLWVYSLNLLPLILYCLFYYMIWGFK